LIIGSLIFVIFYVLGFHTPIIDNIEEGFLLDTFFNFKLPWESERIQEGVTFKKQNPFISPDILIVGIDSKSLQQFGRWPFPRSVEATMINSFSRISDQGQRERALFLDINFIEPDIEAPENDARLVAAMEENGRVFLDTFLHPTEITGPLGDEFIERQKSLISNVGAVTNIRGDYSQVPVNLSVEAPLKPYAASTKGYGNASYEEDVDNVFRRQPLVSRLAELIEEIDLSELTPGYSLDTESKEHGEKRPSKSRRYQRRRQSGPVLLHSQEIQGSFHTFRHSFSHLAVL
jgi:adenylate cyclase